MTYEIPPKHWAVTDWDFVPFGTSAALIITSNIACHMRMKWQTIPPIKRRYQKLVRGLLLWCDTKYYLARPKTLEQIEAGDTLTHTFIFSPWPECQTIWWYNMAVIGVFASMSRSAIFNQHRSLAPFTATFYPDAHPEATSVDGWAAEASAAGDFFPVLRSGSGNQSDDLSDSLYVDFGTRVVVDKWGKIVRSIIVFDMAALPGAAVIHSAVLSLHLRSKADQISLAPLWQVQVYQAFPASDTAIVNGDFDGIASTQWGVYGIPYNDGVQGVYNDIPLNALAILAIQSSLSADKKLRLGLKEKYFDNDANAPPWVDTDNLETQFRIRSADDPAPNVAPRLVVTYSL